MQREDKRLGKRTWNRRAFIHATGATVAGVTALPGQCADGGETSPLIIDGHAHVYGEDETAYPTIPNPYRPPSGAGTISHLRREMQAAGVHYVTAVQTSTFYRWDNRFTVDSARDHRDFMVGIVTLDPDDPASPRMLEEYVKDDNIRGMRSIPAKNGRLNDPGVERLWAVAERLEITVNALVNSDKLEDLEALIGRHPELRVVIDHCLNLKAGPTLPGTLKGVLALAKFPLVHAKLTFIPTGSRQAYPCSDMHRACRQIIDAFGPDRCVWGSNFPCKLWCPRVSYAQHLRIFTHELQLDESIKKAILGETARRLWFAHL